jgi:hypothetical protein
MKDELKSKVPNHEKDKWAEIKSKIKIDHDLGQEKIKQL